MADVLKRGRVEDDQAIVHELADLFEALKQPSQALLSGDLEGAIQFAVLLEDVGNRLIDMSDAINNWYLAPANARILPSIPDLPESWQKWN